MYSDIYVHVYVAIPEGWPTYTKLALSWERLDVRTGNKLSDGPVNALSAELWMKLNGEVQGLQFWFFVLWKFVHKTLKPPVTCVYFNRSTGNTYHRVGLTESYLPIPKHWMSLSWSGSSFGPIFWASGIANICSTIIESGSHHICYMHQAWKLDRDLRCLESWRPRSVMPKRSEDITRRQRDSKLIVDPIGQGELSYLEIY